MNREDLDYDRVMWRTRIIGNIRAGAVLLFLAALCLAVAVAAAPSPAGMVFGGVFFAIFLVAGISGLWQANRIRKMDPKVWFAAEPRPEDEPLGKMR